MEEENTFEEHFGEDSDWEGDEDITPEHNRENSTDNTQDELLAELNSQQPEESDSPLSISMLYPENSTEDTSDEEYQAHLAEARQMLLLPGDENNISTIFNTSYSPPLTTPLSEPDGYAVVDTDRILWTEGKNLIAPDISFENGESKLNPSIGLTQQSSHLDILKYYMSENIVNCIISESNRYAEQVKKKKPNSFTKWSNLNETEFWRFHALQLTTGLIKKPSIKDYWSTDEIMATPFFGQTMSRNRYEDILRSIHFVNNEENDQNRADRYWKFGNVFNDINEKFSHAIAAGQYLTIDETLIKFKGRLAIKQYNPKKRARFGVKWIVLVDCQTKMTLAILPYQGKNTKITFPKSIYGFGGAAALTLMQSRFFAQHIVTLDNWFVSPLLATELRSKNTYMLGTVQKTRKQMPKITTKLKKGEIEYFSSNNGILVERWQDNRDVIMLNTFLSHSMEDAPIRYPGMEKQKPKSVLIYNKKMGGLDDMDSQIKPYETMRKSVKWYKKIYFHLVDVMIFNSYRLFKLLHPKASLVYQDFIKSIIKEILSKYPITRSARGRYINHSREHRLSDSSHLPTKMVCDNGKRGKFLNCHLCWKSGKRSTTAFQCLACKKSFCIKGDNSCFMKYHTQNL